MGKKRNTSTKNKELDGVYFLKLVMFIIFGSLWVHLAGSSGSQQFPIPVGLVVGLVFATHEHFQIDRKIEYAVLLVAAFISLWLPVGIYINF